MTPFNLKPIRKERTLRSDVVEQLKEAIINGDLPPGTKLVESQLSALLGVSRGPLREAIRQLVDQNLIESIPYTGTYVANISVKAIQELYSFRTELEQFAFKLIWDKRDKAFQEELKLQLKKLTSAIKDNDRESAIFEELELHNVVYKHCGHELLEQTWQRLRGRLHLYFTLHQKAHNRAGPLLDAHDRYLELALGDDLNAMLEHITEHMQQGYNKVEQFVSEIKSNTL
ncbi:GntR family transcriptional regulator [Marinomonas flavescens]|uniref:GntR family transcriptional regulator n=1 Tax=Marinomonas flavescens TaxID=2529379 RepID=UPI00105628E8|nr:GntR family transcriptional regulator [Marinomonas flavescens]